MGDHRAHIKVEFSMYGLDKKWDASINWSPASSECPDIDQRVIDFFREGYLSMRTIFDERQQTYWDQRAAEEREKEERAELARLQAKYPATPREKA